MTIKKLELGNFKLDGGAMFGVVPKSLWNKVYPADENNLCQISLRLLLIEEENKKILIDTGLGDKQNEDFFKHYHLSNIKSLSEALKEQNLKVEDISDVLLTHLHFDHCGGAVQYSDNRKNLKPTFPNATYWCSQQQWEWAMNPNQREKASFLKENILPLQESGQLKLFDNTINVSSHVEVRLFFGHTAGQAIPFIDYNGEKIVFMADLIPSTANIPLSWICGYDTQPLISMDERKKFLEEAYNNNYTLFFEHDFYHECCKLVKTEKGIRKGDIFTLESIIPD